MIGCWSSESHRESPYVSKVYCLLLCGSPRRLVLHACGRVTTPPAGGAAVCACGAWVTVGPCFKSMLMLLLRRSLDRLVVLASADAIVCMRAREKRNKLGRSPRRGQASRFSCRRLIEEAQELRPDAPSVRTFRALVLPINKSKF
jgi:hypothetical protein